MARSAPNLCVSGNGTVDEYDAFGVVADEHVPPTRDHGIEVVSLDVMPGLQGEYPTNQAAGGTFDHEFIVVARERAPLPSEP